MPDCCIERSRVDQRISGQKRAPGTTGQGLPAALGRLPSTAPEENKSLADYTGGNIASVRRLARTSADIHHVNGVSPAPDPSTKPILGCFLAAEWGWAARDAAAAPPAIKNLTDERRIDLGLALDTLAFAHS